MPTNFVIGFVLMWLGQHELKREPQKLLTWPLLAAWIYSAVIFCPVTGWSFYAYPAWATVYLRPEFLIPTWAGPVIVAHYFLGMVFGTLLAQFLIQRGEWKWFWTVFAAGVFWLASMTILTLDEYLHLGTYNAYHSGQAISIFESADFQRDLNIMGAVIAIPAAILGFIIWKRSQRLKEVFQGN